MLVSYLCPYPSLYVFSAVFLPFKHIIIRSIFLIRDNIAFLRFSHSGEDPQTHRFIWPPILIVHILLPAEAESPLLPPPQLPAAERPLVILKVISAGATLA